MNADMRSIRILLLHMRGGANADLAPWFQLIGTAGLWRTSEAKLMCIDKSQYAALKPRAHRKTAIGACSAAAGGASGGGLSAGAAAAVALVVIFALAALAGGAFLLYRRRKVQTSIRDTVYDKAFRSLPIKTPMAQARPSHPASFNLLFFFQSVYEVMERSVRAN